MTSFTTDCLSCEKKFKTWYSLKKHVRERHEGTDEDSLIPCFKEDDSKAVLVLHASSVISAKAGYLTWLAGITERINRHFNGISTFKFTMPCILYSIIKQTTNRYTTCSTRFSVAHVTELLKMITAKAKDNV